MIKEVLEHYYPGWDPPEDVGREWVASECPVHDDDNPSAGLSFEKEAFVCHGCGFSGDYISIIRGEEDCSFDKAVRIAEEIAERSGVEIPREFERKPRRGVPRPPRFTGLAG